MSMSPAYHLFSKAMRGEKLSENQVQMIIGVIRKDERQKIIKKIRDTYADPDFEETGSFVFSEDIVELIQNKK